LQFISFLEKAGMPTTGTKVTRAHVDTWLITLRDEGKAPSTVSTRYKALRVFFGYLVEEGELAASPMERMKPPQVPDVPVPVLTEVELRRLIKACEGKGFDERRDNAIVRLFLDTGMRRAELAGLRIGDIDFDHDVAHVVSTSNTAGQGLMPAEVGALPFGRQAGRAR
jgi:integrase